MPKVMLTGSSGALGKHTVLRLTEMGLASGSLDLRADFPRTVETSAHVIHLAGISRGTDEELSNGNLSLAKKLTKTLESQTAIPEFLTYANTTKSISDNSAYSRGKRDSGKFLAQWCERKGVKFRNILLPNLIGPLAEPYRNMVGSSIVFESFNGLRDLALNAKGFGLATLQDAADVICDVNLESFQIALEIYSSLDLRGIAEGMTKEMRSGIFPNLTDPLHNSIYEMLAHLWFFDEEPKRAEQAKKDERGSFREIGKIAGGEWQISEVEFSTGAIRGNHFHRRLVETFQLLRGDLELTYGPAWGTSDGLRKTRLSSDTPFTMPVGIWHSFENQKDSESSMLITANRWFNPEKPDTINCEL